MKPTRQNTMSKKRAAMLEKILDAAEQAFATSGFHGAGISGIAKTCGMSTGHLYHYVNNKEALIEAVVQRELGRHMKRMRELENVTHENVVEGLVLNVARTILHETGLFRTVLNFETLAEGQRNPKIAKILRQHDSEIRTRFCDVLRRLGVPSPETRTEVIMTIYAGLPARALRYPEQERGIVMETLMPVLRNILTAPEVSPQG